MPTNKWILPEGVEDILPEQAFWLELKRREVVDTFMTYGYGIVIPPLIEYHNSLLSNSSEDLDLQTFKLIDQDTGKQLGLRADITSQISRIYSTYNSKGDINRYCYFDHVVRTKNIDSKVSRIPIQAGAELMGSSDINDEAELVILMLDIVKKFTNKKIFLDLGHVGIFKKLISSVNLKTDHEKQIKKLIRSKSGSEIKKYLNDVDVDQSFKECLYNFPKMHGFIKDIDNDLKQLKRFDNNIEQDIQHIVKLCKIIECTHKNVEIKYDFCELQGFDYENDIIFSAYIENDSHEAALGGKYSFDSGNVSGIGFSMDVRHLIKNLSTEKKLVNKDGKWLVEEADE